MMIQGNERGNVPSCRLSLHDAGHYNVHVHVLYKAGGVYNEQVDGFMQPMPLSETIHTAASISRLSSMAATQHFAARIQVQEAFRVRPLSVICPLVLPLLPCLDLSC